MHTDVVVARGDQPVLTEDNQQTPAKDTASPSEQGGGDTAMYLVLILWPPPPHWSMSLLLSQIHTWIFPRSFLNNNMVMGVVGDWAPLINGRRLVTTKTHNFAP